MEARKGILGPQRKDIIEAYVRGVVRPVTATAKGIYKGCLGLLGGKEGIVRCNKFEDW